MYLPPPIYGPRYAKNDRLLFHYCGHGVPKPTANGEVWVFNKNYTQYIPLSVYEILSWIQSPSIVVLECSAAGVLLPFFAGAGEESPVAGVPAASSTVETEKCIVLCPCGANEELPMNPDFPADLFTSCLTTPIPIALRWFVSQNKLSMAGIHPDCVDRIPGKVNDRKTPIGELNWIFTAITDTIAWNTLPSSLFQQLFRQDLLVASLFRNFLLADRILRSQNCTPSSIPQLPPTSSHPLWQSWDLAVETCLNSLIRAGVLGDVSKPNTGPVANDLYPHASVHPAPPSRSAAAAAAKFSSSGIMPQPPPGGFSTAPFFAEQLTAFEVWLEFGRQHRMDDEVVPRPPEQLPVVLQVLLSQAHRVRALVLLRKFLDLGPWAVNLALSVGIFPYVLKLLQSPAPELRQVLVAIWSKILAFDSSCQIDLVKEEAHVHFISHLNWAVNNISGDLKQVMSQRVMAAFVLASICHDYPIGQKQCLVSNLPSTCGNLLAHEIDAAANNGSPDQRVGPTSFRVWPPAFRMWLLICVAELCKNFDQAQKEVFRQNLHSKVYACLRDSSSDVRAAAAYATGMLLIGRKADLLQSFEQQQRQSADVKVDVVSARELLFACNDGSPSVRYEATVSLGVFVGKYHNYFTVIANNLMNNARSDMMGDAAMVGGTPRAGELDSEADMGIVMEGRDESNETEGGVVSNDGSSSSLYMTTGLDSILAQLGGETIEELSAIWTRLKELQNTDPHPSIASAAYDIVSVIHERIFKLHQNVDLAPARAAESVAEMRSATSEIGTYAGGSRAASSTTALDMAGGSDEKGLRPHEPLMRVNSLNDHASLMRNIFENDSVAATYRLPESDFFQWKKECFAYTDKPNEGETGRAHWQREWEEDVNDLDPLSPEGARKAYRERRNTKTKEAFKVLASKYAHLAPKLGGGLKGSASKGGGGGNSLEEDPTDGFVEVADGGDGDADDTEKATVKMDQSAVLDNESDMTSNILFHPYENCLIVADDFDGISVWNFEAGKKEKYFSNNNNNDSRMTSVNWLSDSLLVTGCDDGTVRIWDNVWGMNGSRTEEVDLASSFFGAPDMTGGQRGSGLIMEYQRFSSTLICAGNSSSVSRECVCVCVCVCVWERERERERELERRRRTVFMTNKRAHRPSPPNCAY